WRVANRRTGRLRPLAAPRWELPYRPLSMRHSHSPVAIRRPSHVQLERPRHMPRPAAGGDDDGVGAQGSRHSPGVARKPGAGGAGEAPALAGADRLEGELDFGPGLDLDEDDGVAAG